MPFMAQTWTDSQYSSHIIRQKAPPEPGAVKRSVLSDWSLDPGISSGHDVHSVTPRQGLSLVPTLVVFYFVYRQTLRAVRIFTEVVNFLPQVFLNDYKPIFTI